MTDCYKCGHPILEGQRSRLHPESASDYSHLNVQDCLPTHFPPAQLKLRKIKEFAQNLELHDPIRQDLLDLLLDA